ncbi:hypothetical protein BH09BAC3_BH09BAC3_13790 [soil metagenome]
MENQTLFKNLLFATSFFVVAYWTAVFTGLFPVEEIVSGYKNWFMSFPLPDFYMGICSALALHYFKDHKKLSGLFAAMAGSGLLFLGLYALAYGHNTGLLYILTIDEIIEIGIKIYCLTVGTFLVRKAWVLVNSENKQRSEP